MIPEKIKNQLEIVCDYLQMHQEIKQADCIMVLGTYDERLAQRGVELFLQGFAPLIVFSGGLGEFAKNHWHESEADHFAKIAIDMGVPQDKVLIENKALNTGENATLIRKLLANKDINIRSAILVQKPYMERRSYATFRKVWPELDIKVTSPELTIEEYPTDGVTMERVINSLVGDLQRIMVYPEKGFSIPQEVPPEVEQAFNALVAAGYNKRLIQ
jgi:uncharacterized SAM-binding protein YcdF (DUF218 family)